MQLPQELITQADHMLTITLAYDTDGLRLQLAQIKLVREKIDARKEAITKPMREALASARDLFKPLETTLKQADDRVRNELLRLEEERVKQEAKLAKKLESGKATIDEAMALATVDPKGLFREVKKLKITNKKLIPQKYWVLDEVKLRLDLINGKRIPGATLVKEKTVVSR